MEKVCPILQAGRMLKNLSTRRSYGVKGDADFNAEAGHETSSCLKEQCEWYENGCPAYPNSHSHNTEI